MSLLLFGINSITSLNTETYSFRIDFSKWLGYIFNSRSKLKFSKCSSDISQSQIVKKLRIHYFNYVHYLFKFG